MSTKYIFVFVFFFLAVACRAEASLSINEIMYDSDGANIDWIEVKNDGDDVDLTSIKLLISNSTSNHGIVKYSGSQVLHSGEYAVIVPTASISNYTSKWGSTGNIFTSSYSLTNESATIQINAGDKTVAIDSVEYVSSQGASGDGNSLQLLDGNWSAASPTPNKENAAGSGSKTNDDNGNASDIDDATISNKHDLERFPDYVADIIVGSVPSAGIPVSFAAYVKDDKSFEVLSGYYMWNFGDGTTYEEKGNIEFTHVYDFPGDYSVHLEFFSSTKGMPYDPSDTDDLLVHVNDGSVIVSINEKGAIEIQNKSTHAIALDDFVLRNPTTNTTFTFPKHSLLLANKTMTLSPNRIGFGNSVASIILASNLGNVVSKYPEVVVVKNTNTQVLAEVETKHEVAVGVPTVDLSPALSKDMEREPDNKTHSTFIIVGLIGALGLGIGAYLFFGREKKDGFELVDE